jgi:hypothetical protein
MHDAIHAAIARQRVEELVQTAGAQRTARARRPPAAAEPVTTPDVAISRRRRAVAMLRLRPRLR